MNSLKSGLKVAGWNDGPFDFGQDAPVPLVGVITRGGNLVEGVIKTSVEVDGLDGTEKLIAAIERSRHREDLALITLDGITVGGFNVIDIAKLSAQTGIPVVAVTRKTPDLPSFRKALAEIPDAEPRLRAAERAGKIRTVTVGKKEVCYQKSGLPAEEAERAISLTATHSCLPEPIRLAGMIAKSIVDGES